MRQLQTITSLIKVIRGQRVMLDSDLAELFGVSTKRLNEACGRNAKRFPGDFRFRLIRQEVEALRSQFATLGAKVGRTYLPYAFTEHGALMAANVLRSDKAIETSVNVVRAFVEMMQMISGFAELEKKIEKLENKCDEEFAHVFETLRQLILPPPVKKNKIGFIVDKK